MSTTGRSIRTALRIRVSMSAIGSVIMARSIPSTAAGNAPEPSRNGRGSRGVGTAGSPSSLRSVNLPFGPSRRPASPARLLHARDQALAGQVAEADPADAELAIHGTRAP